MKCEFCGEVATEDFTQCPNCNSWSTQIDKIETRIYYLLGIALALVVLVLSPAITSLAGALLPLLLLVAVLVMVGITASRLRRLRGGKAS